ncbi:MAG: hypothetical protein NPIRA05_13990 [Nitrospirales bacterium]|nr:MAG: hypothetical protein NPIRA05_13990 [Nitrospirales bacterium]
MTIATDSYENIYKDYADAIEWIRSLGVEITSGRTQFYEKVVGKWTNEYRTASEQQGKEIFPDFVSSVFEIMDFIDIYKSLKNVPASQLLSIASKLQKGVNGPINSATETNESSTARNFIFEALVAARSHRPEKGVQAIFDSPSDTGFRINGKNVWVECKRITSLEKLEANVSKACNQLESSLKRDKTTQHRGLVAIDFTKILHQGDKLYVKQNDRELLDGINSIMDQMIGQCSKEWEKVYLRKSNKIVGTLLRFSTMATSEERNLMIKASQWAVSPRQKASHSDNKLLRELATAMN